MTDPQILLIVRNLVKRYPRKGLLSNFVNHEGPAVDRVSLTVSRGEVVGLIGESGSGKTTLARAALGLLKFEEGSVELLGLPLHKATTRQIHRLRKSAQLLLQNPDAALNPGLRVIDLLVESASLHQPQASSQDLIQDVATRVGIVHRLGALPHQLSGGEKRRVGIARLLIADPEILVADEPTSGLDANLKAEIADLLLDTRDGRRGYLVISHDLPLVTYACTRIVVMYAGRILEEVSVSSLGLVLHHPYTSALLAAAGLLDGPPERRLGKAAGRGASGCPYFGACSIGHLACGHMRPDLASPGESRISPEGSLHRIACHVLAPPREMLA